MKLKMFFVISLTMINVLAYAQNFTGEYSKNASSSLVFDDRLYIASERGLIKSDNNGENFIFTDEGVDDINIKKVVGNQYGLFIFTKTNKVYHSTDKGNTWNKIEGFPNNTINDMAIADTKLYLSIQNKGIYRTDINYIAWEECNQGLGLLNVICLFYSDSQIYCGTEGCGIYKSDNSIVNWQLINTGLPNVKIRTISKTGNNLIIGTDGGLFYSPNNGIYWVEGIYTLGEWDNITTVFPYENKVYAGILSGKLLCSEDNMVTWNVVKDFGATSILNINFFKGKLYVGTYYSGVVVSSNNGANWYSIQNDYKTLINKSIKHLAYSSGKLFANVSGALYISEDNGRLWKEMQNAPTSIGSILLADSYLFVFTSTGIFKTRTDNINWEEIIYNGSRLANAAGCTQNGVIYIGTASRKILKTNDYGKTLEEKGISNVEFLEMFCFDGYLFGCNLGVQDRGILYYSSNEGATWIQISNFPGQVKSVIVQNNHVVVVTQNVQANLSGGIYTAPVSSLNNIEWTVRSNWPFSDLIKYDEYILAVYGQGGFFRLSKDLFATYYDVNISLSVAYSMQIGNGYLFIGGNSGIYRVKINSDMLVYWTDIEYENDNKNNYEYKLEQNFPNPFNPTTTISFSIEKQENVSLTIYDLLGREIEVVVNQELSPGKYNYVWNASKYSSGIYFYVLKTKNYYKTNKMILLK